VRLITRQVCFRLLQRGLVGPRVELGNKVARMHSLAFDEVDLLDGSGDRACTSTTLYGTTDPMPVITMGKSATCTFTVTTGTGGTITIAFCARSWPSTRQAIRPPTQIRPRTPLTIGRLFISRFSQRLAARGTRSASLLFDFRMCRLHPDQNWDRLRSRCLVLQIVERQRQQFF
jgi:hypothetical protein